MRHRTLLAAAAAGILAVGLAVLGRSSQPALSRVPTGSRVVALTFDDGPQAPYTGQILGLLRRYHDLATFFVVGREVAKYPTLLRQEVRDGMEIGLHGMTHLNLSAVGAPRIVRDALAEQKYLATVAPALQRPPTLYRTPYGLRTPRLDRELQAAHLTLVLWDVDTRDWARPGVSAIVRQVERLVKPGSIVLFHDGGGNRSETVAALAILLPWLKRQGYQAVTVAGLIQSASG